MKSQDGRKAPLSCDYLTLQSEFFIPYNLQEYTIRENQLVCTGLPRDDQFFRDNQSIENLIPNVKEYSKVIIWAPTFRFHKNEYRVDCHFESTYGLPLLLNSKELNALQTCLEENNVLLLIKPHPAQNLEKLKIESTKNILLLSNENLSTKSMQINELLAQTDALITDYSSIYYDYLFTGNPITLTVDDLTDYREEKGFVFDDPFEVLKGDVLKSTNDLLNFVANVAGGIDSFFEARDSIQKKINQYNDGQSSERVYDFIMSKLG